SRTFEELRVVLRDHLRATDSTAQAAARAGFAARRSELVRLLRQYADALVSDDQDRRLLDDFRTTSSEWISDAERVMSLVESARPDEATAVLNSARMTELGSRTSDAFGEWIAHNEALAKAAGDEAVTSLASARRHFLLALALALLLSTGLGLLTFRSIVGPTRALQAS